MRKIIFLCLYILICFNTYSKNVTLVTVGTGRTPQEATTNALKTAIEQAFGCFVSESTIISNDSIVRDELVSIKSGSIKKYTEIGSPVKDENGLYSQTVESTVSLEPLKVWATQHEISCELDGNLIVQQVKLNKIFAQNARKVQDNLAIQIGEMLKTMYKPTIKNLNAKVSDNGGNYVVSGEVWLEPDYKDIEKIDELIENTLKHVVPKDANGIKNQLTKFNVGRILKTREKYSTIKFPHCKYKYQIFKGSKLTDGYLEKSMGQSLLGYYLMDNMGNKEKIGAEFRLNGQLENEDFGGLRNFEEYDYYTKFKIIKRYNHRRLSRKDIGFVLSLITIDDELNLLYNENIGFKFELIYSMEEMERFREGKIMRDMEELEEF